MLIGAAIGAAIGFAIGYVGKCTSGVCPLTSNYWVSTTVGALMGALFAAGK